jgi:hypothetical protein
LQVFQRQARVVLGFFVAGYRNLLNREDQRLNGTFRIVRHKNKNSLRLQVVPVSGTWFGELSNNWEIEQ